MSYSRDPRCVWNPLTGIQMQRLAVPEGHPGRKNASEDRRYKILAR